MTLVTSDWISASVRAGPGYIDVSTNDPPNVELLAMFWVTPPLTW